MLRRKLGAGGGVGVRDVEIVERLDGGRRGIEAERLARYGGSDPYARFRVLPDISSAEVKEFVVPASKYTRLTAGSTEKFPKEVDPNT